MIQVIKKVRHLLSIHRYTNKKFYSKLIHLNDMCFDIGANKGVKSELFLSLGASVIAFEPQSICHNYLDKIKHRNFQYHKYAVGSNNETKELKLGSHIEVATFSNKFIDYFSNDSLSWNQVEKVTVKKLDWLIDTYGMPNYCKIDVEGYELEILSNLTYIIPLIEFEFTGGFIENTIEIIKLLDKSDTIYNFNLNEKPKFELNKWVSKDEMISIFKELSIDRLHGNIFVKNL
ncbi:FkbM family methyltransferase [Aquimarina sp. BL5]|uniref:FkbM family methyltransferase n=2 Tax=Aquimarina sp. BL5 TaxID=1714860 RepID=UPI0013C2D11E|nr:FkbM family methyltransferase [Aquimarina sp. BL5]